MSRSKTLEKAGPAGLAFEATATSYAIAIDGDRFLDLLDSESYVSENAAFKDGAETLCEKLKKLPGVRDVEYSGHFGSAVYLSLPVGDDLPAVRKRILAVIERHLKWCAKLPKRLEVRQRRAAA